jgi:hypothetical protein
MVETHQNKRGKTTGKKKRKEKEGKIETQIILCICSRREIASFFHKESNATLRRYSIKESDFHRRIHLIWGAVKPREWRRRHAPPRNKWEDHRSVMVGSWKSTPYIAEARSRIT